MKAPDKIFYGVIEGGFQCVNTVPTPSTPDAYIRKDALLEWAKEKLAYYQKLEDDEVGPVRWGQRNAFLQVIDKINSL